jgi:glycosyltransferase involved in cell wall biosynthesis
LKIVLITSGQPTLNPRLVKEADALTDAGYNVTVIYQYWNAWATLLDDDLLSKKKWKVIRIGGDPIRGKFNYWKTRLRQKVANIILAKFSFYKALAEFAIGRCTEELKRCACDIPADLYIAHNLAALPAAVKAAKKNQAKAGFDAEDLHRYEMSDEENNYGVKLKKFIEEKYFPKVDYLTTSSLEINNQYSKLFPHLKFTTILNVFSKNLNYSSKSNINSPLKLVWFSQHIGLSRGLQEVFAALKNLEKHKIELHLLGFLSSQSKQEFDDLVFNLKFDQQPKIFFYPPIGPAYIQDYISKFDIGLALEPGFSINNDLALSNKIFTYIQSGLAIIASNTTAQKQFLADFPNMGLVYEKNNTESLTNAIQSYAENRHLLVAHQQKAYNYANETLNWEVEKEKFLSTVEQTLKG